jgi:hypothetical protein
MSRIKTVPSDRLEAEIFEHLDLESGDPLVLVEGVDFVLVKRAASPALVGRFDELASETSKRFEELGIEPDDIERAVRWAREGALPRKGCLGRRNVSLRRGKTIRGGGMTSRAAGMTICGAAMTLPAAGMTIRDDGMTIHGEE